MKPIIIDMKDMSDSTEVYESRPNPFFAIFIYIVLSIIIVGLAWMYFAKIDIVVKGQGIVRTVDDVSTVTNTVAGKIDTCLVTDGQQVSEGDVLFTVKHEEIDKQIGENQRNLADVNARIVMMKAYLKALNNDESEFVSLNDNKYYEEFKIRKDLIEVNCNSLSTDINNQKLQYNQNINSYNASIDYNNNNLEKLNQMIKSVKDRQNQFDESDLYYYTTVEGYLSSYKSLEDQYNRQTSTMKLSQASQESIDQYQSEKENALYNLEKENISSVEQQIKTINENLVTINNNRLAAESQLNSVSSNVVNISETKVRLTEVNSIYTEVETYESKKSELESNMKTLSESLEASTVKASKSGFVNFIQTLVIDDYIGSGVQALTIIPIGESNFEVESYIGNQDIAKLEENMKVKFEISAFPSSEYGNITGIIKSISRDVKVSENGSSAYYVAKATVANETVYNSNGEPAKLKVGMACQVKVVTEQKRVLFYLLEKIDLWR